MIVLKEKRHMMETVYLQNSRHMYFFILQKLQMELRRREPFLFFFFFDVYKIQTHTFHFFNKKYHDVANVALNHSVNF
jgi:hypothetical protein